MVAHLGAEFLLRIALDVHLAAKPPLDLPEHRKQLSRRNVTYDQKIDVALGPLFAVSQRLSRAVVNQAVLNGVYDFMLDCHAALREGGDSLLTVLPERLGPELKSQTASLGLLWFRCPLRSSYAEIIVYSGLAVD
jgi:hypothetical protein